jgi:DUF1680 family protein
MRMLDETGTIENLRIAAGTSSAQYGLPLFRDSDLYKVLEAIAWERARGKDQDQDRFFTSSVEVLQAAQEQDGYLNSYVQVVEQGRRFANPAMGHELYCAGHLIQAAVADMRTMGGPTALLGVAERFASMLAEVLRSDQVGFVPGHPEIETALVELYRTTGGSAPLELAADLLSRRGRGTLRWQNFAPSYFQDDVPFEQAREIRGHAVRALYLLAGATDLYAETGKQELLAAALAQWADMTSTKTYLTGGVGSRHQGEAFGDPFELPPDRAYCETCASIASIMWNWRLLLLTGEARFAELMERTLYNGFLAGVGLDGTSFFYVNPLQARRPLARAPWYDCACCPPNAMRLLASLQHYLTTVTEDGLQVHHYSPGRLRAEFAQGPLELEVETDYPFGGSIALRVLSAPGGTFEIAARIPSWASGAASSLNGSAVHGGPGADGYLRLRRAWSAGDDVLIELPMRPRAVRARDEIDGIRGCVAFERGPLVYCLEGRDVPTGQGLLGVSVVGDGSPDDGPRLDVAGQDVVTVRLEGTFREEAHPAAWPYVDVASSAPAITDEHSGARATDCELRAVPYFAWANRGASDMRVWCPSVESC